MKPSSKAHKLGSSRNSPRQSGSSPEESDSKKQFLGKVPVETPRTLPFFKVRGPYHVAVCAHTPLLQYSKVLVDHACRSMPANYIVLTFILCLSVDVSHRPIMQGIENWAHLCSSPRQHCARHDCGFFFSCFLCPQPLLPTNKSKAHEHDAAARAKQRELGLQNLQVDTRPSFGCP